MTGTYHNENDPYAAQWLRNLFPDARIDARSIKDVEPTDLARFTRVHLFAGIGGWELALRLAEWPEERQVWTGSCPCQPFSSAGKRQGSADERHLWPEMLRLIAQCCPPVIFGEQVASPDGRLWLAGVRADLEALGYAVGAADLCAAGVSAPHIRQRLYWVGIADRNRFAAGHSSAATNGHRRSADAAGRRNSGRMDDAICVRRSARGNDHAQHVGEQPHAIGELDRGTVSTDGYHSHWWSGPLRAGWNAIQAEIKRGGQKRCVKWRIKPGLPIVAHGVPGRVGKIRAAGNAIVPQLAAEFIRAAMESQEVGGGTMTNADLDYAAALARDLEATGQPYSAKVIRQLLAERLRLRSACCAAIDAIDNGCPADASALLDSVLDEEGVPHG